MKYRGARALPPSVAVWLKQQLEERGIDSSVYTCYILSLLQEQSLEINDLPPLSKSSKGLRINNSWKSCGQENSSVVNCLTDTTKKDIEIESLVDELCRKLKEVNSNFGNCLKEKTNSEDLFNLELPVSSPDISTKYISTLPVLNQEYISGENSVIDKPVWAKNICRVLGRRRDSESSPKENKISKRKEGKENAKGRMRSRSTVKSQSSTRSRSGMAKSLDRSEKGRKCLFTSNGVGQIGKDEKSSVLGREEEFENLPMNFQSLLQSPDVTNITSDSYFCPNKSSQLFSHQQALQPAPGNFIQCGTNITSSIWSSEKMEEDESVPWEDIGKYTGWSDARNSLLSTAWKLPFAYGNFSSNNYNNNNNKSFSNKNYFDKKEDIEGTTLALKNEGAFFSLFDNSHQLSLLSAANIGEKTDSSGKVEPPEQLENLLTSMKTHFKPIKQESVEVSTNNYNDGSSFFNFTCFEEVKYRRSESGSLFLGPDQKYMEFKRTDLTVSPEFVPKFRVCSNEKFCQTDDLKTDDEEVSADQTSESEFFFPGDDRYAKEMNDTDCPQFEVSGWVTTWPVAPTSDDIWSNDSHRPWVIRENENWNSASDSEQREDYTRLRHEITQEGEQLLSDIRFLLQDHRPQNALLVGSSGL